MAEVAFRPVRQLGEYKGKGASASREVNFKLGEEIRTDGIFSMSRAWDKEKI